MSTGLIPLPEAPALPGYATLPKGPQARVAPVADRGRFRLRQWGGALVPLFAAVLRVASPPTSAAAYVVAAVWALLGRRQAVIALFLCWLFNMTSHKFCGPPLYAAVLRYLIILCAFASVFARGRSPKAARGGAGLQIVSLGILGLMILHSLTFSEVTDVSTLKATVFAVTFMTLLCGWAWMSPEDRHIAIQTVFGGLFLVVLLGLPMKLAGLGNFGRSQFFGGVLVQSQQMGVVAGIVSSILACQCLTIRPFRWWRVAMLGLAMVELLWSNARVGMLAFGGSIVVALLYQVVSNAMAMRRENPNLVVGRLALATVLVLVGLTFYGNRIADVARDFIFKYGEDDKGVSVVEAGLKSREMLVSRMVANIRRHPIEGIGFGVASIEEFRRLVVRDKTTGLPVMATIEKGVMPVMVMEELGVPLATIIYLWFIALALSATRGGILPVTVFSSAMITNVAEADFFSPGGSGMLIMLLVCWAVTEPAGGAWKRHLRDRQARAARHGPGGAPLGPIMPTSLPAAAMDGGGAAAG